MFKIVPKISAIFNSCKTISLNSLLAPLIPYAPYPTQIVAWEGVAGTRALIERGRKKERKNRWTESIKETKVSFVIFVVLNRNFRCRAIKY